MSNLVTVLEKAFQNFLMHLFFSSKPNPRVNTIGHNIWNGITGIKNNCVPVYGLHVAAER